MRNINVIGIVFPNQHDASLGGLTSHRALGSVPFGGRYRLIDFVLSNMVNAGISKVGLATKSNYQSLMDHLSSGKAWDLDRKNGGLFFIPTHVPESAYNGRIAAVSEMLLFLNHSKEEYVLMSDCHVVGNIDYEPLILQHIETGADITVAYTVGAPTQGEDNLSLSVDENGRVSEICIGAKGMTDGAFGMGLYVIRRELLIRMVEECYARNFDNFERHVLQHRLGELSIYGYRVREYTASIYSLKTYFEANMALLDPAVRKKVFVPDRRIYTKVRDCAPATYGLHAALQNSLVADGAKIDGNVTNSVIFRDVKVGRGVNVDRCILMQGSEIHADATLGYVICDKNVQVCGGASLQGAAHYPMYVKKGMTI